MTDVKAALKTLGWRVDTPPRLRQAIEDFQRAWNLGPALAADGNAGPKTVAALNVSLASKAAGRGDISANFNASEFACECDGAWPDCRRIWVHRHVVKIAEQYRGLVGPFSPDRGCRCPRENARVGGVNNSQHLYGLALDLPLYAITSGQVQQLGTVSGIGVYLWQGRRYVRHVDARHLRGSSSTPSRPAQWDYGTAKAAPLQPRPDLALARTPPPPTVAPSEEDDMPLNEADLATIGQLVEDKVKVAFIEMQSRATPVDRQAGSAFWQLVRDGNAPIATELALTKEALGVLANSKGLDPGLVAKLIADKIAGFELKFTDTPTAEETP